MERIIQYEATVAAPVNKAELAEQTKVRLTHLGWGEGGEWDQAFAYFTQAWQVVLGRLAHRFSVGPIDWNNPYRSEIQP
jgi:hypothetical protein